MQNSVMMPLKKNHMIAIDDTNPRAHELMQMSWMMYELDQKKHQQKKILFESISSSSSKIVEQALMHFLSHFYHSFLDFF